MLAKGSKLGLGLILLLAAIANTGRLQTVKPDGTVETATHYVILVLLYGLGLWFIIWSFQRKR
jgi:hypothetical protein